VNKLGGIHKFTGWNGPILSDSGGFQVFSLKKIRKLSEEGVEFASHIDGSRRFLTPELSIQIQETLGVDIAMVLDECPSTDLNYEEVERSLDMTIRWAQRSLAARQKAETSIFGITQGGVHKELRTKAAQALSEIDFDGMAIGGLSVGEKKHEMYDVLSYHVAQLPAGKIRYLMGVGTPMDILQGVKEGVDLFDCVMPTRAGRFGRAFTRCAEPYFNIKNSLFHADPSPIDMGCKCVACRNYSKGYINHLFKTGEMLGPQLLSIHNLTHYIQLMADIRKAIMEGSFVDLYNCEKERWKGAGED